MTSGMERRHINVAVHVAVSHRAPPQVADRGRLTRYGGCCGNKIPRVDQNQHYCLVEKGDLQRLVEETLTENQPAQRLRRQPHHWDRVLQANNLRTLNTIVKETEMNSKWLDIRGDPVGMKWKMRIGFLNVRTLRIVEQGQRDNWRSQCLETLHGCPMLHKE